MRATPLLLIALAAAWHGPVQAQCIDYTDYPLLNATVNTPTAIDVAINGSHAYVVDSVAGLVVVNISDPLHPQHVARLSIKASSIALRGNYAYLTTGEAPNTTGLTVVDVSNPANPHVVGGVVHSFIGGMNEIALHSFSAYAYVATTTGIHVFNIANPVSPQYLGATFGTAITTDVTVAGSLLYATSSTFGSLTVLSLANPVTPTVVGSVSFQPINDFPRAVAISHPYAYVACSSAGLRVVDVSVASAPQNVGSMTTPGGNARDVAVSGNSLFLADGIQYTQMDISVPQSPQVGGSVAVPRRLGFLGFSTAMAVGGSPLRAYLAANTVGLMIVQPFAPTPVDAAVTGGAFDVATSSFDLYVAARSSGLRIVDMTTPSAPVVISNADTPGDSWGVASSGSYVYVADGFSGLQVVDVSNRYNPQIVGSVATPGFAGDVDVDGQQTAYIAAGGDGLQIVAVGTPSNPAIVGSVDTPGNALRVAESVANGGYVYIADAQGGLQIADVSVPTAPTIASSVWTGGVVWDVDVSGGLAYVVDASGNLTVFDGLNSIGSLNLPASFYGVCVAGTRAYLTNAQAMWIVDVADPAGPVLIAKTKITPDAWRVAVSQGSYACVADRLFGVHVLPAQCGPLPNLMRSWALNGWDDTIVCRNAATALPGSVHFTALDGNQMTTSFNAQWRNNGTAPTGPYQATIAVDDVARWSSQDVSVPSGVYVYWLNTPQGVPESLVRGGRHHVQLRLDDLAQVAEEYEWDNTYTDSFVWSPLNISGQTPIVRAAPPFAFPSGWGPWPSCEGFTATLDTTSTWMAVACLPGGSSAMYDVRAHSPMYNSFAGFDLSLVQSGDARAGDIEFCVVNGNAGASTNVDFSVINFSGSSVPYTMQRVSATYLGMLINGVTHTGAIDFSGGVLSLFEFQVDASLLGTPIYLSLNNLDATTDVRLDLFDSAVAYASKTTAMASADVNGVGGDEHLPPVTFTHAGFYALAVSKAAYSPAPAPPLSSGSFFELVFSTSEPITDTPLVAVALPAEFALSAPRPNPSRGATSLELAVPHGKGRASVSVYDLAGRRIRSLVAGEGTAGRHVLTWDGRDAQGDRIAAGVYFVRLEAAGVCETKKLTMLR